jgi:hypothetical protein
MRTQILATALLATLGLAVAACDDAQNEASNQTRTGQSGGSAPENVGSTNNAGRTTGTSGHDAIGAPAGAPAAGAGTSGVPAAPSSTGASPPRQGGAAGGGGPAR